MHVNHDTKQHVLIDIASCVYR